MHCKTVTRYSHRNVFVRNYFVTGIQIAFESFTVASYGFIEAHMTVDRSVAIIRLLIHKLVLLSMLFRSNRRYETPPVIVCFLFFRVLAIIRCVTIK